MASRAYGGHGTSSGRRCVLVSIAGLLGWVDVLLVMAGWAEEPEKQLQVAHGRMDGLEDSMRDLMGTRQLTTDPTVTLGIR